MLTYQSLSISMTTAEHFLATWQHASDMEAESKMVFRHRLMSMLGSKFPPIPSWLFGHIRRHLDEHYCQRCGEYIYNPYTRRKIRHYHSSQYQQRYHPILYKRLVIRPQSHMVEWTRHFPHVLRLVLSKDEIRVGLCKILSKRIMAYRLWSVEEWNLFYPSLNVGEAGLVCLSETTTKSKKDQDVLFVPDISFF